MSDWISVKERIPENNEPVLTSSFCLCGCLGRIARVGRLDNSRWITHEVEGLENAVLTHWMKLPAPPKDEP